MTCAMCEWIEQKKNMLFETQNCVVMLAPEPMAAGHMVVVPKMHAPIIESVPKDVFGEMFVIANKASMSVFEGLQAQGTNVLIQNGVPAGQKISHAMIHVIPRRENDQLQLTWQPTQADPTQLEEIVKKFEQEAPTPAEPAQETKESGKDKLDYIQKSLRRIP